MDDYANLSPETVRNCVAALRLLQQDFERGFRIDAINMDHVARTLARVDAERMVSRQVRFQADASNHLAAK